MNVREAAQKLNVSLSLVYSLCAAGKIRHERHGLGRGTLRISEEALEEYRKTCQREGQDAPALRHIQLT